MTLESGVILVLWAHKVPMVLKVTRALWGPGASKESLETLGPMDTEAPLVFLDLQVRKVHRDQRVTWDQRVQMVIRETKVILEYQEIREK